MAYGYLMQKCPKGPPKGAPARGFIFELGQNNTFGRWVSFSNAPPNPSQAQMLHPKRHHPHTECLGIQEEVADTGEDEPVDVAAEMAS